MGRESKVKKFERLVSFRYYLEAKRMWEKDKDKLSNVSIYYLTILKDGLDGFGGSPDDLNQVVDRIKGEIGEAQRLRQEECGLDAYSLFKASLRSNMGWVLFLFVAYGATCIIKGW